MVKIFLYKGRLNTDLIFFDAKKMKEVGAIERDEDGHDP
jgi:hypothetical protein